MRNDNDNRSPAATKAEAKILGLKHYFTGKPCARGHVANRYVSTGQCCACQYEHRIEWRESNPEKERESRIKSNRKWAALFPERKREKARNYNATHSEQNVERARRWRLAHPDRHAENQAASDNRRRARVRGTGGNHTAVDIAEILKRQKFRCAECGISIRKRKDRHVDHIMPIAKGGTNDKGNIQILCVKCNLRKSDKHPIDFARERGRLL